MSKPLLSFENYVLGIPEMDDTHQAFIELLNRLAEAPGKAEFVRLFTELSAHTEAHFAAENQWMQETGFPALREHMDEHQRVLGELHRFQVRAEAGSITMGRAYVQQLPGWFDLHAKTMDSALAAHIQKFRGNPRKSSPLPA